MRGRCAGCYHACGAYRHKKTPMALHHGRLFHLLSCHLRNAASAMARYMCASAIAANTASGEAINKSKAIVTIRTTTRQNSSSMSIPARNIGAMPVTSREIIAAAAISFNVFIACSNVKARGRCRAPLVYINNRSKNIQCACMRPTSRIQRNRGTPPARRRCRRRTPMPRSRPTRRCRQAACDRAPTS